MKILLFILLLFVAVSAALSGILMIAGPGVHLPYLHQLIPEPVFFGNRLLLATVLLTIGLLNLTAAVMHASRHKGRYNWAVASGVSVSCWILVQMILQGTMHWFYVACLFAGLFITLIAWQLKGKWVV